MLADNHIIMCDVDVSNSIYDNWTSRLYLWLFLFKDKKYHIANIQQLFLVDFVIVSPYGKIEKFWKVSDS